MAITETYHTEIQSNDSRERQFTRYFEGLTADLTLGANGWTGTGLPLIGDQYPYGTWTSKVTPRCVSVQIDPNPRVGFIGIISTYACPRVLGD